MQKTRQRILEYLRGHGEATVEDLSASLDNLTPVTVRHHLDVMRTEGLIEAPAIRHRASPGRPCYTYRLSARAEASFPHNLRTLTTILLTEMKTTLNEQQVNVIFEGVADRMSTLVEPPPPGETTEQKLSRVVEHLTEHGYAASWEMTSEGYVLHTCNCPYGVADVHPELCNLDVRYISGLLGMVPRRLLHLAQGDSTCSYLIPLAASENSPFAGNTGADGVN